MSTMTNLTQWMKELPKQRRFFHTQTNARLRAAAKCIEAADKFYAESKCDDNDLWVALNELRELTNDD